MLHTVLGDIAASAITGAVLPHEHLVMQYPNDGRDGLTRSATVVLELDELRTRHDLELLVDLTCLGLGRQPEVMAEISRRSGVAVIAATGFYWEKFHPDWIAASSVQALTEWLMAEITEGLDGTGIRPGVIGEVGSHGESPSAAEQRCLRAAARAAVSADLSVSTHAELGEGGAAQLEILCSEGLEPHRVCIGHQDLITDRGRHLSLVQAGCYIAFDTIGKSSYQSDEVRLELMLALIDAGFAERLLVSNDVSRDGYLDRPTGGYGHLFSSFLPALARRGVDVATLRQLTHDNPLRFLTGTG
jgi:phosphotriesterase-related protein